MKHQSYLPKLLKNGSFVKNNARTPNSVNSTNYIRIKGYRDSEKTNLIT